MGLFNFFKTKKEEQTKEKFVGRHQWVLIIRQILDEIVSEIEMQIAINKDTGERNEVLERIVKLEDYIHSEYFTTQLDVSSANEDINFIIDIGYDTCVFPNDSELENRCLEIYENILEYAKNIAKKNNTLTDDEILNLDKVLDLKVAKGFLQWMTLNGVLETSDEQHAWIIMSSLLNAEKIDRTVKKGKLVRDFLATLGLKDLDAEVNRFQNMKQKLLENGKITSHEAERVDKLIQEGIEENKKIHEKYPNRR